MDSTNSVFQRRSEIELASSIHMLENPAPKSTPLGLSMECIFLLVLIVLGMTLKGKISLFQSKQKAVSYDSSDYNELSYSDV